MIVMVRPLMGMHGDARDAWRGLGSLGLRLAVLASVTMFTYGLVRPPVESLFLSDYGKEQLPYVWSFVAAAAALVTWVYSWFAKRTTMAKLFRGTSLACAGILVVCLVANRLGWKPANFALYVWKDVYIVVLVEVFWSTANLLHKTKQATWSYGVFLVFGSVGSIAGEQTARVLSNLMSSNDIAALAVPVLCVVAWAGSQLAKTVQPKHPEEKPLFGDAIIGGLQIVWRSRYLTLMVALVAVGQLVITLVDYQFNAVLEVAFPVEADRTGALSNVYTAINIGALILQLLSGPVLALVGVGGLLIAIPVLGVLSVGWLAMAPRFLSAAVAKVLLKSADYSFGRTVKEMLYIPRSYAEQTRGKAVADILTYRATKGLSSLLLGALLFLGQSIVWLCMALFCVWIALAVALSRRYRTADGECEAGP